MRCCVCESGSESMDVRGIPQKHAKGVQSQDGSIRESRFLGVLTLGV